MERARTASSKRNARSSGLIHSGVSEDGTAPSSRCVRHWTPNRLRFAIQHMAVYSDYTSAIARIKHGQCPRPGGHSPAVCGPLHRAPACAHPPTNRRFTGMAAELPHGLFPLFPKLKTSETYRGWHTLPEHHEAWASTQEELPRPGLQRPDTSGGSDQNRPLVVGKRTYKRRDDSCQHDGPSRGHCQNDSLGSPGSVRAPGNGGYSDLWNCPGSAEWWRRGRRGPPV